MHCKSCGSAISKQSRVCPSCGRNVGSGSLGRSGLHEQKGQVSGPLSPSNAVEEAEFPLDDEMEVDEVALEDEAAPARRKTQPREKTSPRPGKSQTNPSSMSSAQTQSGVSRPVTTGSHRVKTPENSSPSGSASTQKGGAAPPSPAEVRALVVERPEMVEPGLSVSRDDAGRAIGARLSTEVGEIDLLARDDAGGLVVVMVPNPSEGKELVGEILQRIGWARKHKASNGQVVRGIVLLPAIPDELKYAAAAVADTVSFKIYQLSVSFADVTL